MTWRQSHLHQVRRVPSTQNYPSVIRLVLQLVYHVRQLIYPFASIVRLSIDVFRSKVPPLEAIDGS